MMLTPIEEHRNNIFIKRDDLFKPYPFSSVNGGKLRQCISLIEKHRPKGIISLSSLHSPQCAIVPAVAKAKGLDCLMLLGGKKETRMTLLALEMGAEIVRCNSGRHNVLLSIAKALQQKNRYYIVDYGMNESSNIKSFYDTNADQVENIPNQLDGLVVTCGSGITATGIIYGLTKYRKSVKRLYLIGTAPNRMKKIKARIEMLEKENGTPISLPEVVYDNLYEQSGFCYEKKERANFFGIPLHPNYEAKTFKHFHKKYSQQNEKVLYWIVGGLI